jgi:hypothetical protein
MSCILILLRAIVLCWLLSFEGASVVLLYSREHVLQEKSFESVTIVVLVG